VTEATQTPSKIFESTSRNTTHYTTEASYKMEDETYIRYWKCKHKPENKRLHTNEMGPTCINSLPEVNTHLMEVIKHNVCS